MPPPREDLETLSVRPSSQQVLQAETLSPGLSHGLLYLDAPLSQLVRSVHLPSYLGLQGVQDVQLWVSPSHIGSLILEV